MNLNSDAKDAEQKSADKTEKVKEKKTENKGSDSQPKSTGHNKPAECAGCGKAIKRKAWYYRNGTFYCTKKCYKRKLEATSKESEKKSE